MSGTQVRTVVFVMSMLQGASGYKAHHTKYGSKVKKYTDEAVPNIRWNFGIDVASRAMHDGQKHSCFSPVLTMQVQFVLEAKAQLFSSVLGHKYSVMY